MRREVWREYHAGLARGWSPEYAFESVVGDLAAEAEALGVWTTDSELREAVSRIVDPTVRVPRFRPGSEDARALVDRVWTAVVQSRRPLDRKYAEAVLRKMHQRNVTEVVMDAADWEALGCSRQVGTRALARVARPEVQPFLIRSLEPETRVGRAIAASDKAKGRKPRWFYRLRHRAPREAPSGGAG